MVPLVVAVAVAAFSKVNAEVPVTVVDAFEQTLFPAEVHPAADGVTLGALPSVPTSA